MRLRNNKIIEMEQQDDIFQNASESDGRDTQPTVPRRLGIHRIGTLQMTV